MCFRFEDADDGLGDEDPVYANCILEDEPLYENFSHSLSGLARGLGHYSNFLDAEDHDYSDDEEHIYEHVHHAHHTPVNVFLALLQGPCSAPISPDPNIYEVPPGAIRPIGDDFGFDTVRSSGRNITPPSGFQVRRGDSCSLQHGKSFVRGT